MNDDATSPDPQDPWRRIDPPELAPPVGYSNAVESRGGRRLCVAGQTAMAQDGTIAHLGDLASQADRAFGNVAAVLLAAKAKPEHVVRMRIFVLDVADYRAKAKEIGRHYRKWFGRWYPAMTLVQVAGLYDAGALLEVEAEAVVPDGP